MDDPQLVGAPLGTTRSLAGLDGAALRHGKHTQLLLRLTLALKQEVVLLLYDDRALALLRPLSVGLLLLLLAVASLYTLPAPVIGRKIDLLGASDLLSL